MLSHSQLAKAKKKPNSASAVDSVALREFLFDGLPFEYVKQGTHKDNLSGMIELEEATKRLRRNTMQFPLGVGDSPTSTDADSIKLKEVEGFHEGAIPQEEGNFVHSSYPDPETESRDSREFDSSSPYVTKDLIVLSPNNPVIREGDLSTGAESMYQQLSPQAESAPTSKLSLPKVRSSPVAQPSAWSEGQNLIQEYGYISPEEEKKEDQPKEKDSGSDTELETIRSFPRNKTIGKHSTNVLNSTGSENLLCSAASVAGISSKKGSISQVWAFGDVDGLERTSLRSSRSEFSFGKMSVRKYNSSSGTTRRLVTDNKERKKSVDFKENKKDSSRSSISHESSSFRHYKIQITPWIGGGIAAVVILLFIYSTLISVKAWSASKTTRSDVANYFLGMNETGREAEMYKILRGLDKKSKINEQEDDVSWDLDEVLSGKKMGSNNTHFAPIKHKPMSHLNYTINSFAGINPKYQGDYEIRALMENDRLYNTFHGLAYAPRGVIEPMCQATQRDVLLDMALLSRVTTRIRTYGTQCRQAELVLNSFKELNLNMTLALGVWIGSDDYTNWKQLNEMKWLLSNYPRKYFESIYVGNEVMFRQDKTVRELVSYIEEVKSFVDSIGFNDLPVGTSELGSQIKEEMIKSCDFIGANIHPFFGGENAKDATSWSVEFLEEQVLPMVQNLRPEVEIIVSEIGWPSGGGKYMDANAGYIELRTFLENWVCSSIGKDRGWYYFEAFDEPWKKIWHEEGSKWETEWGFFTSDRQMKPGVELPACMKPHQNLTIVLG